MGASRDLCWLPPVAFAYVVAYLCAVTLGAALRGESAIAHLLSTPGHPLDWLFVVSLAVIGLATARWLYLRYGSRETPDRAVR